MKKDRKLTKTNKLILTILLILTMATTSAYVNGIAENSNQSKITNSSLVEHGIISIMNDGAFESYSFTGNGSKADPYIIENLNITTTSNDGIIIGFTTKQFIIRNCYVQSARYGIYMHVAGDYTGTIYNNTVKQTAGIGLYLFDSDGFIVANNTLENTFSERNMKVVNSEHLIVANNTLLNCPSAALLIEGSDNGTYIYNHFENNVGYGIVFDESTVNCRVHHNNFINNNPSLSQAYVSWTCSNIVWYDTNTLEGNYWDSWVSGNYTIAGEVTPGEGGGDDPYPLASALDLYLPGYPAPPLIPEFALPLIIVALTIPVVFGLSLKRRRKRN